MLLDKMFIRAMEQNMVNGIKNGRQPGDWRDRDEAGRKDRYDAIGRHYEKHDFAAVACNAMFCWVYKKMGLM